MIADEAFWLRVLGRERIPFDAESARPLVDGATVLVTGAGGTIGSALVQALLALGARLVLALDWSENLLFALDERHRGGRVRTFLGSVLDPTLLDRVMLLEPSLMFHAAAVKHVARAEREPAIAARVNVGGTFAVAACDAPFVRKAVLISTDKAAAPTTVMGQTKRVAEAAWTAFGARGVAVRPVNVIGSSGSVGETFLARLRAAQPVEANDAWRMFLTAEETAAFILDAASHEPKGPIIAFPDPEPQGMDMRQLASAIHREVGATVPLIGPRKLAPYEKANEALIDGREGLVVNVAPGIGVVANLGDIRFADEVSRVAETGNDRIVREILARQFSHKEAA